MGTSSSCRSRTNKCSVTRAWCGYCCFPFPAAAPTPHAKMKSESATPNHALQRTAPRVTARAFCERSASYISASVVRSTVGHAPRHAPPSLSLGSLGVTPRLVYERRVFPSASSTTRHLLRSESLAGSPAGQAGPRRFWAASRGFVGAAASRRFGFQSANIAMPNVTPNHALQRTATGCHGGCSPQSLPRSRRASPPPSLSLRSLGDSATSTLGIAIMKTPL